MGKNKPPAEGGNRRDLDGVIQELDEAADAEWPPRRHFVRKFLIEEDPYKPVYEGYLICHEALKTANSGVARAFYRNVAYDTVWGRAKDATAGAVGFAVGTLAGDPFVGIALAAAAAASRNVFKTWFGRRKKDRSGRPDLPELRSAWNQTCYQFARIVHCYNIRVEMVDRLYRDADRLEGARRVLNEKLGADPSLGENPSKEAAERNLIGLLEEKLVAAQTKLAEIGDALVHIAPSAPDERDELIIDEDPLRRFCGGTVPEISWLDDDRERVTASKVAEQVREDLLRIADEHEVDDFLREADLAFRQMEEEHGEEVDAILASEKDEKKND